MLFTGFFGWIGVSTIFYLNIPVRFLKKVTKDDVVREDAATLAGVMMVVV